jgi:hypothetical protein
MKGMLMALGFVFCTVAWTGCGGPDKAKMEACTKDPAALKDGDGCKACCKEAGASGHAWMGLDEPSCSCM